MTGNQPYDEKELLFYIAAGDEQAFKQLYESWYDRVYGTALLTSKSADLASDIAQDVFLSIWKNRGAISGVRQLSSYLFVATRNTVFNMMKKKSFESSYRMYSQTWVAETSPFDDTPAPLRLKELQGIVEQAVSRLPPQQQRAFRLSREQGLTHEQIAQEMGVAAPSVKDYIVRALAFLRTHLKEIGEMTCLFLFWK